MRCREQGVRCRVGCRVWCRVWCRVRCRVGGAEVQGAVVHLPPPRHEMSVPNDVIGSVIGKRGSKINEIRQIRSGLAS